MVARQDPRGGQEEYGRIITNPEDDHSVPDPLLDKVMLCPGGREERCSNFYDLVLRLGEKALAES